MKNKEGRTVFTSVTRNLLFLLSQSTVTPIIVVQLGVLCINSVIYNSGIPKYLMIKTRGFYIVAIGRQPGPDFIKH